MAEAITRQPRSEEVRQERRRKRGSTVHFGMKLDVPDGTIDRNTYVGRWVNDTPGRIQKMMDDDWDKVPVDGASVEARVVSTGTGKPVEAVLMRKRKDWYAEDQKEKMKPLDEMDAEIRRGKAHEKNEPALAGDGVYTPNGVNIIERQR